ncbi:odorant receptor 46a [Sipha flava]|uniref:Odorant receptor 46a n=1 Tax=Sipha flava TaxID=143950 RepID=A0A2S2R0B0_9HEMI|nr:odorant receptor 46a [Sipha flava]
MLVFLLLLTNLKGRSIISGPSLKLFSGGASLAIEIFIYCYIFDHIETAKSKVNFGLYSSDWTAKDLKFKKTLLLVMNMNSAHNRLMKIKPESVVNLELFAKVVKLSYSIVSVLLKTNS